MPVLTTFLIAMPLALALASGLSAVAARSARPADKDAAGPWWGSLAVGFAYILGQVAVATPAWPPSDISDRIPYLCVPGNGAGRDPLDASGERSSTRLAGYLRSWTFTALSGRDAWAGPGAPGDIPRETTTGW